MDWQSDLELMGFFREDGQRRKELNDRFLQNYAAAWGGLRKTETGIDDVIPQSYVDSYFAMLRKQEDADGTLTLEKSGCNVVKDADGNVWFQNQAGYLPVLKQDIAELITFLQTPAPQQQPSPMNSTVSAGQSAYNYNPTLKYRMEENLKQLEQWSKASSKSYPKSK